MKIVIRVLAAIGALTVVAVVAGLVWFAVASRPADQAASPTPSASGAAGAAGDGVSLQHLTATANSLTGSGDQVHITGLDARGVVPFAAVAAQIGDGAQLAHDGAGHVRMTTGVEALGRTVDVVAVGSVRAEGTSIAVDPESVELPGLPGVLDDAVSAVARRVVTIRQPVQGLPAGASIADLSVADDGFHVHLVGDSVTTG